MADRGATIEAVYEARQRGDLETIFAALAPDARYRLIATAELFPGAPVDDQDAREAIGALVGGYRFHEIKLLDILLDGDKAAVRMRVHASFGGGPVRVTELLDFWTFDAEDRVTEIVEFADTALAAQMMAAAID